LESLLSTAIAQRFRRLCRTVGYVPQLERGILGNLGQFIDVRPSAQFPLDAPWNSPSAPLRQTSAQWPARPSVDPEALKFAAAWRRMYLTPRPPIFGAASDPPQTYSERYGQSSSGAEKPEFLSEVARDGDWTRAAELNGRYEFSLRSLPVADMGNGTNGVSRLAGWPSANAPAYSMPSAAAVPASYQAGTRPWWAPVSPPGIFDPWREHALKGLWVCINSFTTPARTRAAAIEMVRDARRSARQHERSARNCCQNQIRRGILPEDIAIPRTAREVM
jgi:hypothetical protein